MELFLQQYIKVAFYGINPDTDSTALMVSTTSWILARCIKSELNLQQKEKFGSSLFEYLLSQFVP